MFTKRWDSTERFCQKGKKKNMMRQNILYWNNNINLRNNVLLDGIKILF